MHLLELLTAVVSFLMIALAAYPQEPVKVFRIGFMANQSPLMGIENGFVGFREGLRDLGWQEGRNIRIVWKSAEGRYDRHLKLAEELTRVPVDVIVAFGPGVDAAARVTKTIPIVMGTHYRPIEAGLAQSLAHPGGNVTGLIGVVEAEGGIPKQLQLLKQASPRITRVALITQARGPAADRFPDVVHQPPLSIAATELRLDLFLLTFGDVDTLEAVFQSAVRQGADAIAFDDIAPLSFPEPQRLIANLARTHRMPVVSPKLAAVANGVLMAYGTHETHNHRRAAYFVDRILRGAKPANLPIERPIKPELHINLGAAKAIGLQLPAALMISADRVFQ